MNKEYKKYFENIKKTQYEDIKNLIEKIRNFKICSNCGSYKFDNANCKYCYTENNDLKILISSLDVKIKRLNDYIENIPKENIIINKVFNLLYSVCDKKIPSVDNLLEKFDYANKFKKEFEKINDRIKPFETKFSDLELDIINTVIFKEDPNFNMDIIFDEILRNIFIGNKIISFECFKKLISEHTEDIMRYFKIDINCKIIHFERYEKKGLTYQKMGIANDKQVILNDELLKMAYYEQSTMILQSIYHELTHVFQINSFYNNEIKNYNNYMFDMLKDLILSERVQNYYQNKYDSLIF